MTMMTFYTLCMAVGGVLIGASVLFGDADSDADLDIDADADLDLDGGGDLDVSVLPFGSLRFWTFALESFGLAGVLLTLAQISPLLVLATSGALGLTMGWGAFRVFRYLAREEVTGTTDLIQMNQTEGRVLVRIPVDGTGKIVVDQLAGRVEMMARTMDEQEIPHDARVLIVAVNDGVAQVTSLTPQSSLASQEAQDAVRAAAEVSSITE